MTLVATTARRRPASHAFTVPLVRELAPQTHTVAAGTTWQTHPTLTTRITALPEARFPDLCDALRTATGC